jgi:hypothetical protein
MYIKYLISNYTELQAFSPWHHEREEALPLPSRASVESEGKMAAEGAVAAAQHIDKEHCNIDWIANQSYQKGKR